MRHSYSFSSALFRVVSRGITCFENCICWCLYKDAVAELLDGSEGDGRAKGCEIAEYVDVGVLSVPNCSKGGVDLFWWFITLKSEYSGSIVSQKRNLTRFLRFSFHGISLKPRRINICVIPAATAIEWLRCRGIAILQTRSSTSNVVPSTISGSSLFTVRYLFAKFFSCYFVKKFDIYKFSIIIWCYRIAIPQLLIRTFLGHRRVVFCIGQVVHLYFVSYASVCASRFVSRLFDCRFVCRFVFRYVECHIGFCRYSCRFCLSELFQVQ